ncbi:hypothetical protein GCM10018785_01640 [Streptomyces longispororuber]|uniref:Uncharacterized protein n=1 Tax=Streptomyces longispororuber TaxID=68230 RepID=A0A918Z4G5_9ACTN|nr:hypothetical protein [Streptomyces longispororuber]GHE35666.1 hypothetical protein GCM10018785_01640 [Streptomyces longispororuber]
MTESTPAPTHTPSDQQVVERLVPAWLAEAAEHAPRAADHAEQAWREGRLSADAARELADWATARVTDTAFNEDEGPVREGHTRVTVADKEAVHRWLRARGHDI